MSTHLPIRHGTLRFALWCVVAIVSVGPPADARFTTSAEEDGDLTKLSLEELMDIDVTIASRKEQKLSEVPGAVYVITGDEIRRSGHTSVQEALRMVPGFYVSHWTNTKWDVTSRGFGNGVSLSSLAFLNQLLVLVDGVVVYTPLFAGTWWEIQDVDLDDIDRIEIIRGPGGILWGSNAVHGVVHIITKKTEETQGLRLSGRGQNDFRGGSARYGGRFGETGSYRVFYRYVDYETPHNPFLGFDQSWQLQSTGFRADWGEERKYTLWGRAYDGEFENDGFDFINTFQFIPVTDRKEGYQVFASTTSEDGKGTFSAWVNQDTQELPTELDLDITSYDVEYKRDFELTESVELSAGAGFRHIRSELIGADAFFLFFDPIETTQNNYRAFAVATWACTENIDLLAGAQIELNEFTDFEFQPTVRANWRPMRSFSTWAAITKSARTPSLEEVHLDQNSALIGDPDFQSEDALAYEVGVRKLVGDLAVLDFAAFYNDYDDLHHQEDNGFGQSQISNEAEGESYGVEVAIDLKPCEDWSLRTAYSWFDGEYTSKIDGSDEGTEGRTPKHQLNLRSYYDINERWELDTGAYFVEDLGSALSIGERWRLDVRFGYHPSDDLEVYFGAQQLNENTEAEFDQFDNRRRQFYLGMTWTPGSSRREEAE